MDEFGTVFFIILVGLICLIGGCNLGESFSEWQAVEQGKAEYYLDEHHNKQWRWKP